MKCIYTPFESGDWEGNWTSNWCVSAGTWEASLPTLGPNNAYEGQNCAATVIAGNYSEPVNSRFIKLSSFNVPPVNGLPRLRFWHWYSFSSGEYGEVKISKDGGWTDIRWVGVVVDLAG